MTFVYMYLGVTFRVIIYQEKVILCCKQERCYSCSPGITRSQGYPVAAAFQRAVNRYRQDVFRTGDKRSVRIGLRLFRRSQLRNGAGWNHRMVIFAEKVFGR